MFGWLYKRVAEGVTPLIIDGVLDYAESKEGAETITAFIDGQMDRQIARVQGSIGGSLKGSKGGGGMDFGSGNIWGMLIQAFMSRQAGGQSINSSPVNELYKTG